MRDIYRRRIHMGLKEICHPTCAEDEEFMHIVVDKIVQIIDPLHIQIAEADKQMRTDNEIINTLQDEVDLLKGRLRDLERQDD